MKILLIVIGIIGWASETCAYDNVVTHKDLTEKSVAYSVLGSSGKYLMRNYGAEYIENERSAVLGRSVSLWFQDGADFEDELPIDKLPGGDKACRAANHFHNPIKGWQDGMILPWDQAQMTKKYIQPIAAFVGCGKRQRTRRACPGTYQNIGV